MPSPSGKQPTGRLGAGVAYEMHQRGGQLRADSQTSGGITSGKGLSLSSSTGTKGSHRSTGTDVTSSRAAAAPVAEAGIDSGSDAGVIAVEAHAGNVVG